MSEVVLSVNTEHEKKRLTDVVSVALDAAKTQGATSAEMSASLDEGLSVRVRNNEIDTLEHSRDKSMAVTVYIGQKKGSAATTDFSELAVRETVEAACNIARYTSEDEYAGLADKHLMADELPDLDLFHQWTISADEAVTLAQDMEASAKRYDKKISNTDGASVNRHQSLTLYANSHGFVGMQPRTRHSLSCSVIAGEGTAMQRDHWFSVSRVPESLQAPQDIGEKAASRAIARLGARPIKTGSYPVLFSPEMARGLLSSFISAISGSALYRRNTFLLDKQGESVFSDKVRISENPCLPAALGSSSFDNDGLARRQRDIVTDGILQGYVLSTYSARKLGVLSTANAGGVRNLTLHPGQYDDEEMLSLLGTGLYVTEMMGQGAKLTTGDYSRGAAGFWVENGKITHPVQEVTIAGNLKAMFLDIKALGRNLDLRGNIRTPAVLVGEMVVAGQ